MKRAVIYARVSTQRQADDGVSMESQIEQCRVKAASLDAEVVEIFRDDGVSGRTDHRAGFQTALAYCAANKVSYFVSWSSSRFGRNLEDALRNTKQLMDWGTKPTFVHQDIDLDTDTGWIMSVISGMMDEWQSRTTSRDTLRSMMTASKDGFFVGGRAPYGYKVERVEKRSRLVIHEEHADVVRMMFSMVLVQNLGAQAIALYLNENGHRRDGRPWGKNTISLILKNESYMGKRMYNRTHNKTRLPKPLTERVGVKSHPALITEEDFEKVQSIMKSRIPHDVGGTPKSSFAFSGLLKCGICGQALQIRNGTGRGGVIYNYYACLAHKTGKPRCCLQAVRAEAFDVWMVDQILDRVLTVEVVEKAVKEIQTSGGKWLEEREVRRRGLVRELRETEGRRNKLYDILEIHGKDAPNLADLKDRLRTHSETIRTVERSLEQLEDAKAPDGDLVDIDPVVAVEAIRGVLTTCDDPKRLRALLGTFIQQIAVSNSTIIVEYRQDALLRSTTPTVHSGVRWLLNLGSNQGPTD